MGFTWIFGYIAAFTNNEVVWYIYVILNSLQGVFIFIVFMCKREIASLWKEKLLVRRKTTPHAATGSSHVTCSSSSSQWRNAPSEALPSGQERDPTAGADKEHMQSTYRDTEV